MDAISAGTVVKLAKTVYTRIDGVKVDKKQCAILKARVKSLEQVVLKAKPHAGVKDLVREMERILQEAIDFIDEEEKRGWLKRVAVSKKTKLEELSQRLDKAMSQLSAEAVLDMAANQKEMEAAAREDTRMLQELLTRMGELEKRGELDPSKAPELVDGLPFDAQSLQDEITDHLEELKRGQRELKQGQHEMMQGQHEMMQLMKDIQMQQQAAGGGGGGGADLGDELRLKPGREHIDFDKPTLGEGSFAEVRAGTYEFRSGQEEAVAYKIFKGSLHLNDELRSQIIAEAKLGHRLTHPNLIRVWINNPRFRFQPSGLRKNRDRILPRQARDTNRRKLRQARRLFR